MATNVQVYQDPAADGWSVKVTGEEESQTRRFPTREEAEEAGRALAEERGLELLVHDDEGKTQEKESFS